MKTRPLCLNPSLPLPPLHLSRATPLFSHSRRGLLPILHPVCYFLLLSSSDGRVLKASASGVVVSGLILSRVKPMTLKLVFTASLVLHNQHSRDSVENKPASLLVVSLEKALSGIPPSWCGKQMAGNSSASLLKRLIAFSWKENGYAMKYCTMWSVILHG